MVNMVNGQRELTHGWLELACGSNLDIKLIRVLRYYKCDSLSLLLVREKDAWLMEKLIGKQF